MTLIVDTGGNTLAAQTIHGYGCAARPANKLRAINTEKHFDHIGGDCRVQRSDSLRSVARSPRGARIFLSYEFNQSELSDSR